MKIKYAMRLSLLALVLTLPEIASADVIDYAVTLNNELGTIDLQTGAFTQLGTVTGISSGDIGDLARLPGGLLYGMNASSELVLIDPVALTTSVVGDSGHGILGLAFRPDGTLFGVSLGSGLYTINPNTGAATLVAALTGTGFPGIGGDFDIKFDNTGHTYLLTFNNLYTVNTSRSNDAGRRDWLQRVCLGSRERHSVWLYYSRQNYFHQHHDGCWSCCGYPKPGESDHCGICRGRVGGQAIFDHSTHEHPFSRPLLDRPFKRF
jgi:hypothetical protein